MEFLKTLNFKICVLVFVGLMAPFSQAVPTQSEVSSHPSPAIDFQVIDAKDAVNNYVRDFNSAQQALVAMIGFKQNAYLVFDVELTNESDASALLSTALSSLRHSREILYNSTSKEDYFRTMFGNINYLLKQIAEDLSLAAMDLIQQEDEGRMVQFEERFYDNLEAAFAFLLLAQNVDRSQLTYQQKITFNNTLKVYEDYYTDLLERIRSLPGGEESFSMVNYGALSLSDIELSNYQVTPENILKLDCEGLVMAPPKKRILH